MDQTDRHSSPFTEQLGVETVGMGNGQASAKLEVREKHLNSGGIVHGGVLMTLADCVSGAAAFSVIEKGQRAVTTDAHVTCLRSVTQGVLNADAEVLHASRRFIHVRLSISAGDKLVASGVMSFMRLETQLS